MRSPNCLQRPRSQPLQWTQIGSCNIHVFSLFRALLQMFSSCSTQIVDALHRNMGMSSCQEVSYAFYCLMQFDTCFGASFSGPHYSMFFCTFLNLQLFVLYFLSLFVLPFDFLVISRSASLCFPLIYYLFPLFLLVFQSNFVLIASHDYRLRIIYKRSATAPARNGHPSWKGQNRCQPCSNI